MYACQDKLCEVVSMLIVPQHSNKVNLDTANKGANYKTLLARFYIRFQVAPFECLFTYCSFLVLFRQKLAS